jgi:hypothetical protein
MTLSQSNDKIGLASILCTSALHVESYQVVQRVIGLGRSKHADL